MEDLRKELIEFAEWREETIILTDTTEEMVDEYLQEREAKVISSNAMLAVSLPISFTDWLRDKGYEIRGRFDKTVLWGNDDNNQMDGETLLKMYDKEIGNDR